jgi:hypothetical protein
MSKDVEENLIIQLSYCQGREIIFLMKSFKINVKLGNCSSILTTHLISD